MRRGTTPTLVFELPFETEVIEELYITFLQGVNVVCEKTKQDVSFDGNIIYLHLDQTDTLAFTPGKLEGQIRVVTLDGERMASDIFTTTAERILKDGDLSAATVSQDGTTKVLSIS